MGVSHKLADIVSGLSFRDLPEEVVDITVSCLYNYMGCVYSGSVQPPPQAMLRMLRGVYANQGKCTVVGTDFKTDPVTAALVNGTAANAMAYDDMFKDGIHHPGASAITAALAISEAYPVTGQEFITAVVLGYEVSNRIARACNPSHYQYWHTAATAGSFGAAVVAAKLLKLSKEEIVWALGSAGTQATGLQECTGNMAQRFHLGTASRNGVLAALLAKHGFDGPPNIIDGPKGFFTAMSQYQGDIQGMFDDIGQTYTILDTTFKFYPCCGHIHACIDGAVIAMEKGGVNFNDIESVEVATYQTAITNSGNPTPKDIAEAKFSIPYCVAAGLVNGKVTVQEFQSWPPTDEVRAMMDKITVVVDDIAESEFPGQRGAKVTLKTKGGAAVDERRHSRKGDPDCPLSRKDIVEKYRALSAMVLPYEKIHKLEELIGRLPELEDCSVLLSCQ